VPARHDDEGIAVGRRLRGGVGCDSATGARAILDDDIRRPALAEFIGEGARHDVDGAAGREWNQEMHRLRRKTVLRAGYRGQRHDCKNGERDASGAAPDRSCHLVSSPHANKPGAVSAH